MKTLVYKRTHTGDPDETGVFGCNGCMGQIRAWKYDAAIGIGGASKEPVLWGIAGKITWIGVGRRDEGVGVDGHPLVTFDTFRLFDEDGPLLKSEAPLLDEAMYGGKVRAATQFTPQVQVQIERLLAKFATDVRVTRPRPTPAKSKVCRPMPHPKKAWW